MVKKIKIHKNKSTRNVHMTPLGNPLVPDENGMVSKSFAGSCPIICELQNTLILQQNILTMDTSGTLPSEEIKSANDVTPSTLSKVYTWFKGIPKFFAAS